jgi:hypothetical protein
MEEQVKTETQAPVYDPNKNYTWTQDTEFVLSGGEFGAVLNAIRAALSTKEAQTIIALERASLFVEKALAEAVMEGKVKEKEQE